MDATGAFEDIGHSDYARELLEQYEIAKLAETGSNDTAGGAKKAAPRAPSISPSPKGVCDLVPKSVMYCTTVSAPLPAQSRQNLLGSLWP